MALFRFQHKVQSFISSAIILGLCMCMSVAIFVHRLDVPAEGDLGCFMAIAQQLHAGAWLYEGVWDNKAPGVFLLHALAQTLTDSPNYPLFLTIGLLWLLALSAAYRFRGVHPVTVLILGSVMVFWYLQLFVFWEVSYIGGFTEEWGLIFMLSAWLWFDAGSAKSNLIISGLLFGAAVLIKEPFALFYPVFLLSGSYRSIWLPQKRNLWHFCAALPWLIFAGIYLLTGRFDYVLAYLRGAFLYSGEGELGLEPFTERFDLLKQYWNPYLLQFWSTFVWGLRILGLRLIWLLYRRYGYQETYSNGPLITAWAPALIAASVFLSLGAHPYLHYGIPFLALMALGFLLLIWDMVSWFSGPFWTPWKNTLLALTLALLMRNYLQQNRDKKELMKGAKWEKENVLSKIPLGESIFFDAENMGRFYWYLEGKAIGRYPVPYYTYFYNPNDNQREDLVLHRKRFKKDFLENTPEIIVSKDPQKSAPVFDFVKLQQWLDQKFTLSDSFEYSSGTLYIRRHRK